MPMTLSIENVPDSIIQTLCLRAYHHQRSLQSELLSILAQVVQKPTRKTASQVLAEVQKLGLQTPAEAVTILRGDRDAH